METFYNAEAQRQFITGTRPTHTDLVAVPRAEIERLLEVEFSGGDLVGAIESVLEGLRRENATLRTEVATLRRQVSPNEPRGDGRQIEVNRQGGVIIRAANAPEPQRPDHHAADEIVRLANAGLPADVGLIL